MFSVGDFVARSPDYYQNWIKEVADNPLLVTASRGGRVWFADRRLKRDAGWLANRFIAYEKVKTDYDTLLKGLL